MSSNHESASPIPINKSPTDHESSYSFSSFANSLMKTVEFQYERRNSSFHHMKHSLPVDLNPHVSRLFNNENHHADTSMLSKSLESSWDRNDRQERDFVSNLSLKDSPEIKSFLNEPENDIICQDPLETDQLLENHIHDFIPNSSFAQTTFNAVNILMGIGLLSLPYAFRITGWVVGIIMMLSFSLLTRYTARLLSLCLDHPIPPRMNFKVACTFGDFGELAFGNSGRTFISVIFTLELFAATVALVILTADSMNALFPNLDLDMIKACIVTLMLPATLPKSLHWASYGSLLGILAIMNLLFIIVIDGTTTFESPGSILVPCSTNIWPQSWFNVPLAIGLFMSGFCGHSVFPSLYRDMINPKKYYKMVDISYIIITVMYFLMAVIGYMMFGDTTREEITLNLATNEHFNPILTKITIWLIALNPLTKYPLSMNPVNNSMDRIIYKIIGTICPVWILRIISRCLVSLMIVWVSISFPGFDVVMGILGSFFSFMVSVIFVIMCYLRLYYSTMKPWEIIMNSLLIIGSIILGLLGTLWTAI